MTGKGLPALIAVTLTLSFLSPGAAFAEGDAAIGEKLFNKCKTCHIVEGEGKRLGPSLECVFGRTSGTLEGYKYSPAMAGAGIVWSEKTLEEYLENPKKYVPGNRMPFPGFKTDQEIRDLLAYLVKATQTENCPK